MWPLALVSIGCIPFIAASNIVLMKAKIGQDLGNLDTADELNNPGDILIETLSNSRTVASLTIEKRRYEEYRTALYMSEKSYRSDAMVVGLTSGAATLAKAWTHGLLFFWGGHLLVNYPSLYKFTDFLIADFSIFFSMYGLGIALMNMSDRKEVEKSAQRILYLLDRKSKIDSLSIEGKKLI